MIPRSLSRAIAVVVASLWAMSVAQAQPRVPQYAKMDFGKSEYERRCAICHGLTAKGDGPMAAYITRKVPDLTTLAKDNDGVLPVSLMVAVISGDKEVPPHGTRDMPIWGTIFRAEGYGVEGGQYPDMLYDPDAYVRARILLIVDYVNRLQVK